MANKFAEPTFGGHARKGTRKGVKANHPGVKLVTIENGIEKKRVRRDIADGLVKSGQWRYCAKNFELPL